MSYLPSSFLKFIKILGITPDKMKGINNLAITIDKINEKRACYATFALSLYYIDYEFDSEKVCKILHIFLTKYPDSTLFLWLGALVA